MLPNRGAYGGCLYVLVGFLTLAGPACGKGEEPGRGPGGQVGGPNGGGQGSSSVGSGVRVIFTSASIPKAATAGARLGPRGARPALPGATVGPSSWGVFSPTKGSGEKTSLGPAGGLVLQAGDEDVRPCSTSRGVMGPERGLCITPTNLMGWAERIELGGSRPMASSGMGGIPEPSRCGPGRLVAINSFSDSGQTGRSGGAFDLLDPKPIGGNTALDCEEYPETRWDSISVGMTYLDASFRLGGATWTVRFVFEPNPLDVDPIIADPACMLDAPYIDGQLYLPAEVRVARGDMLLCKKTDGSPCAHGDFRWVDAASGTLSAMRPTDPLQARFMSTLRTGQDENGQYQELFCNTQCERNAPYCGYDVGGYDVSFSIPTDRHFWLYSDEWVTDVDPRHPAYDPSRQQPGSGDSGPTSDGGAGPGGPTGAEEDPNAQPPVPLYHYRAADGRMQSGVGPRMDVVVTFDTTDFLFVEGIEDPEELADKSVPQILSRLHLRDMFARDRFDNFGHQPVSAGWVDVRFRDSDEAPSVGAPPSTDAGTGSDAATDSDAGTSSESGSGSDADAQGD